MTTTHKDPRTAIEQLVTALEYVSQFLEDDNAAMLHVPAALAAGHEALEEDCRIELVTTIHMLASDFENRLGRLDPDDRKIAEGDIAHARANAAKWNQNGSTHPNPVSQHPAHPCYCL